jgi:ureidoglycolate lyase
MIQQSVQELTLENFSKYGSFANMINPKALKIGKKPIEFFRDMVLLDLATSTHASFSVCRVEKRSFIVDVTEFHSTCGEGILPLDADVLIHVGLATPQGEIPLEQIEIFRVPQGTLVSLRPGIWHHAPFAYQAEYANVLIVLPERTYANDCTVQEIPEGEQIEITLG